MEVKPINNENNDINILILKKALLKPIILDFRSDSKYAKFLCVNGCEKCCGYTYYLPSETMLIPSYIMNKLIIKEGKYEIERKKKRCIFFDENMNEKYFCSIHKYRPLRCRIYPYFPLIVDQRIVITLEPALKMLNSDGIQRGCPGFGVEGNHLENTVYECLLFFHRIENSPSLLKTIILEGYFFNQIRNERWFIE